MPLTDAPGESCRRSGVILICYLNGRKLFRAFRDLSAHGRLDAATHAGSWAGLALPAATRRRGHADA